MKKIIACCFLLVSIASYSQDSFIQFDKDKYEQGDTLKVSCQIPSYKAENIHFSSLYLFIENINTKQRWRFRYPLINGIGAITLAIDSAMPKGKYAFSFLTRKAFFSIRAKVEKEEDIKLTYSMLTKNNTTFSDRITTDKSGKFSLNGVLFEDSCHFIFLADGKKNQPGLKINIVTPLDSSFAGDQTYSRIVSLGNAEPVTEREKNYHQDITKLMETTTLPDVVVSTKLKKIALFNEQFSSDLFKNAAERVFDGLEDDQIARSISILDFLASRIAGLKITQYKNQYILRWRDEIDGRGKSSGSPTKSNVDVYLDEILLDEITQHFINSADVAMIKVYNPPANFRPLSTNGAIAIYTKRPGFENEDLFRNRFTVFGYSTPVSVWK